MSDIEPKAWSIANSIMAGMGAVIVILLGLGFNSILSQIKDGDTVINARLAEIIQQHKETSNHVMELIKDMGSFKADLAIIKTNQVARMERERIESERKARDGR